MFSVVFFFFGYARENRTVFMMIETNEKMIKKIIQIPLFHTIVFI